MYLLEHDAKALLAHHGVPVPDGTLVTSASIGGLPPGPWVVKGQLAAGGRGKAGIIRRAATPEQVAEHARAMLGRVVGDKRVESVRVEQQVSEAAETYFGLLLDASAGGVRVIVSEAGGMDIEALPPERIRSATVPPERHAIVACIDHLVDGMEDAKAAALRAAAARLSTVFLEREAILVEVNPLFVKKDGAWLAGDAKIVTDDNALDRQPFLRALAKERRAAYPEVALKLEHGFDYVVVDPEGEIGLLTTGAGLSMMLIDELRARGLKPFNFLDIRTGGLRGETTRLVKVLEWIGAAPRVRVVLVNMFGGITDMGEFSRLLLKAMSEAPALKAPLVVRLAGNGLDEAREVLGAAGIPLHTDLEDAVAEVRRRLAASDRA
jgi:succinyl-CoA synthetase beta subunit